MSGSAIAAALVAVQRAIDAYVLRRDGALAKAAAGSTRDRLMAERESGILAELDRARTILVRKALAIRDASALELLTPAEVEALDPTGREAFSLAMAARTIRALRGEP